MLLERAGSRTGDEKSKALSTEMEQFLVTLKVVRQQKLLLNIPPWVWTTNTHFIAQFGYISFALNGLLLECGHLGRTGHLPFSVVTWSSLLLLRASFVCTLLRICGTGYMGFHSNGRSNRCSPPSMGLHSLAPPMSWMFLLQTPP